MTDRQPEPGAAAGPRVATKETLALAGDPDGALVWDWMGPAEGGQPTTLLLLINGYQRNRTDFRALRRRLHGQDTALLTVSLDNRGVGETNTCAAFTLEDMAGDVVRLASLCLSRWPSLAHMALLGISMGGMIAQEAAARLCAPTGSGDTTRSPILRRLFLVSTRGGSSGNLPSPQTASNTALPDESGSRQPPGFDAHLEAMRRYFGSKFLASSPLLVNNLAKNTFRTASDEKELGRSRAQRQAVKGFDGRRALEAINRAALPVTIMCGDEDAIMPPVLSRSLAHALSDAELILYPGAGHLLLIEEPEAFANDIRIRLGEDRSS